MKFLFIFLLQYAEKSFVITFVEENITVIIHYIQNKFTYHIYSWVFHAKERF